jgi:hypothetical protein
MKYLATFFICFIPRVFFAQSAATSTTIAQEASRQATSTIGSITPRQSLWFSEAQRCGTWKAGKDYFTEWETVDTLKGGVAESHLRHWVEDAQQLFRPNIELAIYAPCGTGSPTVYIQNRVCSITGIRQTRQHVYTQEYTPAPKTEYEKTIDSLKAKAAH